MLKPPLDPRLSLTCPVYRSLDANNALGRPAAQARVARDIAEIGQRYHGKLNKARTAAWSQDPLAHTTMTVRKGSSGASGVIQNKLSNEGTLKYTTDSTHAVSAMEQQVPRDTRLL